MALWGEIAGRLNSCVGARKTAVEWRKCWHDMKRTAKDKAVRIKTHQKKTGGGPTIEEHFTPFQERLLSLIGNTVVAGQPFSRESGEQLPNSVLLSQETPTTEQENFIIVEENLIIPQSGIEISTASEAVIENEEPLLSALQVEIPDPGSCTAYQSSNTSSIQTPTYSDSCTAYQSSNTSCIQPPTYSDFARKKRKRTESEDSPATIAAEKLSNLQQQKLEFKKEEAQRQEKQNEALVQAMNGVAAALQEQAAAQRNIAEALASIAAYLHSR